jgi:hypothetical protein
VLAGFRAHPFCNTLLHTAKTPCALLAQQEHRFLVRPYWFTCCNVFVKTWPVQVSTAPSSACSLSFGRCSSVTATKTLISGENYT